MNTGFQPFTTMHGLAVLLSVAFWAVIIPLARRWHGTPRRLALERTMGWLSLGLVLAQDIWWMLPENFQAEKSLPLQLCDIADLLVPLVWFFQWRKPAALVYFWGMAFSTQAFITPALTQGPSSPAFWFFWMTHAMIVGTACFTVAAGGFRPMWPDYVWAMGMALLYVCVVLPVDVLFGFNYGFVGNSLPEHGGLAGHLGPWPWRVLALLAVAFLVSSLLLLPWVFVRARESAIPATAGEQT